MPEVYSKKERFCFPELDEMEKSGRHRKVWDAFVVKPKNVIYEDLDSDEEILIMGRSHIITNFNWVFGLSFLFFLPLFWKEFPFFSSLSTEVNLAIDVFWYLGVIFYVILNTLMWFYNVYIVTNERVIDIDFLGLLNKTVNVTQISKIEDVNFTQKGLFASWFNYGDVVVETASEQRTQDVSRGGDKAAFTFRSIGEPNKVTSVISELMEFYESK